jgi:hypothetical protein
LLHGVNPYPLIGPGLEFDFFWNLLYPMTAGALVLPLGALPELPATLLFVAISAALLTYGLTADGWQRLWILPSSAFVIAVMAGQWSPLFCAALLLPPVAVVAGAKPTVGLAIIAAARSNRTVWFAFVGGLILLAISLLLLPEWPRFWFLSARAHSAELQPVVTWVGGPTVLLALLRWRSADAWLLLAMSLVPITAGWYEVLPLLLIAKTKRECQVLALISSCGYMLQGAFLSNEGTVSVEVTKAFIVAFAYLPTLILILRRPHSNDLPAWLSVPFRLRSTAIRAGR